MPLHSLLQRLQNPKLEKAEILELTVEYIRTKATAARDSQGKLSDYTSLSEELVYTRILYLKMILLILYVCTDLD